MKNRQSQVRGLSPRKLPWGVVLQLAELAAKAIPVAVRRLSPARKGVAARANLTPRPASAAAPAVPPAVLANGAVRAIPITSLLLLTWAFSSAGRRLIASIMHLEITLQQDIVSAKFVRADVAVVETLTWVSGFPKAGPPPGTHIDPKGRLCTRLLQVMVRDAGKWRIASYHNTDVKPGTSVPEPK